MIQVERGLIEGHGSFSRRADLHLNPGDRMQPMGLRQTIL
jgi:hypothetical protein